jgi:serine/threonine-protein phosphatase 5
MATNEERAVELKNEGNKAFMAHDWPKAVDLYTQAIDLNPNEATFFANRAQVREAHSREAH